jgi:tripartite-type tricarboxylate transporter receptor subunit TctC
VAKRAAEIAAIQREPASVQRIREMGAEPFIGGSSEFTAFYRNEVAKWAAVIKTSGLKID